MIRVVIITCCLALLSTLGAAVEASCEVAETEALTFEGTILEINQGQGEVTVEGFWNGALGKLAFKCPAVTITRKGKDATGELKDLKKDMPVKVTFHRDMEAKVVYADAIVYEPAPKKKKSKKSGGGCGKRSGGGCPMSGGSRRSSRSGGCPYSQGRSKSKTRRSSCSRKSRGKSKKKSGGRRCPVTGKRY